MTEQSVERVVMMGSGPRWKTWNTYMLLMSIYQPLRLRIADLCETVSREEVLKILDEYTPAEPKGGPDSRPSSK